MMYISETLKKIGMATIKSFTDISQSKRLAEILPIESADMVLWGKDFKSVCADIHAQEFMNGLECRKMNYVPCWSLAALLDILPVDWWDYNKHYFLETSKMGDVSTPYIISYFRFREQSDGANFDRITHISFQSDNPIDACYEMIIKLNEQKLL